MTHQHSTTYLFQLALDRAVYDCTFFITDDRLITVTAAGAKRTEELGMKPPRALAQTIAMELLKEHQQQANPPTHEAVHQPPPKPWLR